MEKLKTIWYIERSVKPEIIAEPKDYKIKSFKYNWVNSTNTIFQLRQNDLILDVFCRDFEGKRGCFFSKKEALKALKKFLIKWHRDKEKELKAIYKKLVKVSKELERC